MNITSACDELRGAVKHKLEGRTDSTPEEPYMRRERVMGTLDDNTLSA